MKKILGFFMSVLFILSLATQVLAEEGTIDYNRYVLNIGETVWVNFHGGDWVYFPNVKFFDHNGYVFPHQFKRLTKAVVTGVLVDTNLYGEKIKTPLYRVRFYTKNREGDAIKFETWSHQEIPQQKIILLNW